MSEADEKRRPIKERSTGWARALARGAAAAGLSPNQISVLSVVLSALGAIAFAAGLYLVAGLAIGGRLVCNMIDGMVAVEHNRRSPSGDIFNELPDRLSDSFSLLGAGSAACQPQLALWAALLAVLTAYVRTLSTSAGAPADFSGPMAKQQRMKLLIAGCTLCAVLPILAKPVFTILLLVIIVGCALTCVNRTRKAIAFLEDRAK